MPTAIGIDNLDSEYQLTINPITKAIVSRDTQTVAGVSVDFLPAALNDATTHVLWQVLGADVKVELDGSTATAATGVELADESANIWSRSMISNATVIRSGTTSAVITIYELQKGSSQKDGVI